MRPSIETLRQSFDINYCTTYGWCEIESYRECFTLEFNFVCSFRFIIIEHKKVPFLITLKFILEASNLWMAVFSHTLFKQYLLSDFLAIRFLVMPYVPNFIWVFSVRPSAVETKAYSRMDLYCCWLSHLFADLYFFLIYSRHLCL